MQEEATGTRAIKPFADIDLRHEKRLCHGHHYWATASVEDYDKAVLRRAAVLKETKELEKRLRAAAAGVKV